MGVAEVARFEGVGRGVIGLIRLWKCVEKSEDPRVEPTRGAPTSICEIHRAKTW